MSKQFLVSVMAAGCLSRFRNGVQFTKEPKELTVDETQLSRFEADSYLKVKVLSDDANNDADNGSDALAVDANTEADAGSDTDKDHDADTNAAESADVSEGSTERLNIVVEAMRGLNLDMTADKPTVKELKEQGLDVSAKERDVAWNVLATEHTESKA